MANALKAINRRVNELAKRHPKSKRTTLQKQAGREWKAGKLKKKAAPKKAAPKKAARRKVAGKRKYKVTHRVAKVGKVAGPKRRRRSSPRKKAVRVVHRTRTVTRYKTVRGPGISTNKMLLLGGLVVGGVLLYNYLQDKQPATGATVYLTGNPARDNAAQNLVAYAQAANLGISAITNLINSINSWGDSSVISASTQVQSGGTHISDIAVLPPSGGPSIHLG
jgi:hypothetical protein